MYVRSDLISIIPFLFIQISCYAVFADNDLDDSFSLGPGCGDIA